MATMKNGRYLGLLAAFFASVSAFAGNGSSGGGTAIICKDSKVGPTDLTMLDYYESLRDGVGPEGWLGEGPLFGPESFGTPDYYRYEKDDGSLGYLVFSGRADDILYRLEWGFRYFPALMDEVKKKLNEIKNPRHWTKANLSLSPDVDLKREIPRGCRLIQVALRKDGQFYIDDSYKALSQYQLAVLWFHEAIYAIAGEKAGLSSAEPIRRFFRSLYATAMLANDSPGWREANLELGERASEIFKTRYLNQDDYSAVIEGGRLAKLKAEGKPYDEALLTRTLLHYRGLLSDSRLHPEDRYVITLFLGDE